MFSKDPDLQKYQYTIYMAIFQVPPGNLYEWQCPSQGEADAEGEEEQVRFWNNSECANPICTQIGTTKQLDTKNKPVMYFFKILKIDPPHGEVKGQNFTYFFYPKSRYGLSFGFGWSDVDKNWHSEAT